MPEGEQIQPQHYAFLVSEDDFDAIYGKIHPAGCSTGRTRAGNGRVRSTPTTAAAVCTSAIPQAITWRS